MLFTFYLRLIGNGTQFIGIVINKEKSRREMKHVPL